MTNGAAARMPPAAKIRAQQQLQGGIAMRRRIIGSVVVSVTCCLFPRVSNAQGTSAATIAGVVKDASGAVLPGVIVEAASPALIEKSRTAVTEADGQYTIIELRPGAYTVTFTLEGFNTF